jgi:hypothetical protein
VVGANAVGARVEHRQDSSLIDLEGPFAFQVAPCWEERPFEDSKVVAVAAAAANETVDLLASALVGRVLEFVPRPDVDLAVVLVDATWDYPCHRWEVGSPWSVGAVPTRQQMR